MTSLTDLEMSLLMPPQLKHGRLRLSVILIPQSAQFEIWIGTNPKNLFSERSIY